MTNKLMKPEADTGIFGTRIMLDGTTITDYMGFDPLEGRNTKVKDGYWFRWPDCNVNAVQPALEHLEQIEGGYNWWFRQRVDGEKTTVDGFIVIADKMEATMFAVSHMAQWQKWSRAQETEAAKERRRKPNTLRVTKDGRVKARVTVSTISDL